MSNVNYSNYKASKAIGDQLEAEVLKIAKVKDPNAHLNTIPNTYKQKDIVMPLLNAMRIECKSDRRSEETGNFFFESACTDRAGVLHQSGIKVTEAYWWVHADTKNQYWIKVSKLKELCTWYTPIKSVTAEQTVYGYAIPISQVMPIVEHIVKRSIFN